MKDRESETIETKGKLDLEEIVSKDPAVHGGDLVFAGTRVPARFLSECLKAGYSLEEFLKDYPTVERRQVEQLLDLGINRIEADIEHKRQQ